MTDVDYPSEPPVELPPPPPEERRHPVASAWLRGGELLLELVLMLCTFGFGWVGWWIVAWADGQSPAKVVLHLHVVEARTGRLASFGRMALREGLGKGVAGLLGVVGIYYGQLWLVVLTALYGLIGAAFAAADPRRRMVWDLLAGTVVIEGDPPPIASSAVAVAAPVEDDLTPAEADTSPS